MEYKIAIPSIARAETIYNKTFNYLAKTNIDFKKVYIFLSDGTELDAYKNSLKDYPVNFIVTEQKHVNTQRNFICDYFEKDELICGIDDDIDSLQTKINDKKTTELIDLDEFIKNAFYISQTNKCDLWGVNPVLNPFFLKQNVSFNLKYIVACFYGWKNTREKKCYVSAKPEYGKEDYERSIRYYINDGGVARFNYVAPKTKYYSESGGIQTYRTVEYEEKAVKWLLKTFPAFCKRNTAKKTKYPEVRLIDQRKKRKINAKD
jgi:hypothetical protein